MVKVQTIQVSSSSAAGGRNSVGGESDRLTWSSTASWEELCVITQLSKPQAPSGFLLDGQEQLELRGKLLLTAQGLDKFDI